MTTGATDLARRSLSDDAASWWRKSPSRRDRRSVRHGPADGLRPASWSGNRPLAGARCRDRRPAPQPGGFVRESVRTCGRRGVGLSPGRLYLFSPLPLPSPWSVLFPAPIPGGAPNRRPRAWGFLWRRRVGRRDGLPRRGETSPCSAARRTPVPRPAMTLCVGRGGARTSRKGEDRDGEWLRRSLVAAILALVVFASVRSAGGRPRGAGGRQQHLRPRRGRHGRRAAAARGRDLGRLPRRAPRAGKSPVERVDGGGRGALPGPPRRRAEPCRGTDGPGCWRATGGPPSSAAGVSPFRGGGPGRRPRHLPPGVVAAAAASIRGDRPQSSARCSCRLSGSGGRTAAACCIDRGSPRGLCWPAGDSATTSTSRRRRRRRSDSSAVSRAGNG